MTTQQTAKPNHSDLENLHWHAVMERDRSADGHFVFAVHTTGIYCRPSCPARRPHRKNVTFYPNPSEATAAGYRPCLRCHPLLAHIPPPQTQLIAEICRYIEQHSTSPSRLADLSKRFHLSPYYLQRQFKHIKGISPRQYAEHCRLTNLKHRLQSGQNITHALYASGYQSSSTIYERVTKQLGMTPSAYQQGGKDITIHYTIIPTPIGHALLATTERGLIKTAIDPNPHTLQKDLAHEYPNATLTHNPTKLHPWTSLLLTHLTQPNPHSDTLTLNFQWKAWNTLQPTSTDTVKCIDEILATKKLPHQ